MKPDTNTTSATNATDEDERAMQAIAERPDAEGTPPKERKPRAKRSLDERIEAQLAGRRNAYERLLKRETELCRELDQVRTERRTMAGELRKYGVTVDDPDLAQQAQAAQ